jgi:hypothetical protein
MSNVEGLLSWVEPTKSDGKLTTGLRLPVCPRLSQTAAAPKGGVKPAFLATSAKFDSKYVALRLSRPVLTGTGGSCLGEGDSHPL